MSDDRHLVDTIKAHFARKSSTQLQTIVQGKDQERWSPEAIVAASEVLEDRLARRAIAPLALEEDPLPPRSPPDPYSLAFLGLGLLGGLSGLMIVRAFQVYYGDVSDPDLPVPFGPKMAWLALDTRDTKAVAVALDLREVRAATWREGIDAAHQLSVFVTPPLADWTLVVGAALFPPGRAEVFVKPILERLSREYGEAQYFCTHRDVELHVCARARQGKLARGYGWLGERSLTLWDEGALTQEERNLGFGLSDGGSLTGARIDENYVMQLANLWSIAPISLGAEFKEPEMGVCGTFASAVAATESQ